MNIIENTMVIPPTNTNQHITTDKPSWYQEHPINLSQSISEIIANDVNPISELLSIESLLLEDEDDRADTDHLCGTSFDRHSEPGYVSSVMVQHQDDEEEELVAHGHREEQEILQHNNKEEKHHVEDDVDMEQLERSLGTLQTDIDGFFIFS